MSVCTDPVGVWWYNQYIPLSLALTPDCQVLDGKLLKGQRTKQKSSLQNKWKDSTKRESLEKSNVALGKFMYLPEETFRDSKPAAFLANVSCLVLVIRNTLLSKIFRPGPKFRGKSTLVDEYVGKE